MALAAPDMSVQPAPDGTLLVVGNGWRPQHQLVVSLGHDRFRAFTDSTGSFEISTGLDSYLGAIAVHHLDTPEPAFVPLKVRVLERFGKLFDLAGSG